MSTYEIMIFVLLMMTMAVFMVIAGYYREECERLRNNRDAYLDELIARAKREVAMIARWDK